MVLFLVKAAELQFRACAALNVNEIMLLCAHSLCAAVRADDQNHLYALARPENNLTAAQAIVGLSLTNGSETFRYQLDTYTARNFDVSAAHYVTLIQGHANDG